MRLLFVLFFFLLCGMAQGMLKAVMTDEFPKMILVEVDEEGVEIVASRAHSPSPSPSPSPADVIDEIVQNLLPVDELASEDIAVAEVEQPAEIVPEKVVIAEAEQPAEIEIGTPPQPAVVESEVIAN